MADDEQTNEYKFHSIERKTPYSQVISIDFEPKLHLGIASGNNLYVSQLELITQATSFEKQGTLTIKVKQGSLPGNYPFPLRYANPRSLKKELLKLYNRIQKAHRKNKAVGIIFPLKPKPLD